MKSVHQFLYNAMLGASVADEARRKRDELGADTIPQVLTDDIKRSINAHIPTFIGIARASKTYRQWQHTVLNVLGVRAPTQLDLIPDDEELFIDTDSGGYELAESDQCDEAKGEDSK